MEAELPFSGLTNISITFYKADLEEGKMTRETAAELLSAFPG